RRTGDHGQALLQQRCCAEIHGGMTMKTIPASMFAIVRRLVLAAGLVAVGWTVLAQSPAGQAAAPTAGALPAGMARATLAGGCFWCVESDFDKVPGVISTTSGYTGGHVANPSYEQVSSKHTGHAEAVEVVYDPKKVSYDQLLAHYWHTIDPITRD